MAGIKTIVRRFLSCLHIPKRGNNQGAAIALAQISPAGPAATGQQPPPGAGGAGQPQPQIQQQPQVQPQQPAPVPVVPAAPAPAPAPAQTRPVKKPDLKYETPLIGTNFDPWLAEPYLDTLLGGQEYYQFLPELQERLTLRTIRPLTQDEMEQVMKLAGRRRF